MSRPRCAARPRRPRSARGASPAARHAERHEQQREHAQRDLECQMTEGQPPPRRGCRKGARRCMEGARTLGQAVIVALPTTASSAPRNTAVWPGAAPSKGSSSSTSPPRRRHGDRLGAVAKLDAGDVVLGAVQAQGSNRHAHGGERLAGTDGDGVRAGVGGQHVERLARSPPIARPRRWPTVKLWWPAWRPTTVPAWSTMSPGRSGSAPWRARKAALPGPREEAEVLGLGALATISPASSASARTSGLRQVAEREAQPPHGRRAERGEHVRLVLGRVGGRAQQPVLPHLRVVPGGEGAGAEAVGEVEHRVEPDVAVAADARVRGQALARGRRGTGRRRPRGTASRRSSVRCGRPMPWATIRARRTALAEQQLASASFSASRHSSSVTQTTSAPERCASSAATAESTPPDIATRTRSRPVRRGARLRRGGPAQRLVQRVGGQVGGVQLARRSARPARRRRRGRSRGRRRAAARRRRARPRRSRRRSPRRSRTRRSPRPRRGRPRPAPRRGRGRRRRPRPRRRRGRPRGTAHARAGAAGGPRTARTAIESGRGPRSAPRYARSTYRGSVNVGNSFGLE